MNRSLFKNTTESVWEFYEFVTEIYDAGPRGSVNLATRRHDGSEVVVKTRRKRGNEADEPWRTIMEQLQGLRFNRHVLCTSEIYEDCECFYVVMPRCRGGELYTFLTTEPDVPESECKRIIREILFAVEHLHEGGLIHRDIKPENILFDLDQTMPETQKTLKLIDFDTCMPYSPAAPRCRQFVGTPGYIAPEVLLGKATPQSDLWSVGVILHILMTGFLPWADVPALDGFVGSSSARRMYQALKREPMEWDADPWPEFPLARDLCQKLMAFGPADRPLSATEALGHEWLQEEDVWYEE